jgi:hypothetical protein
MAANLAAMKNFILLIINRLIFFLPKIIAGFRYFILRVSTIAQTKLLM